MKTQRQYPPIEGIKVAYGSEIHWNITKPMRNHIAYLVTCGNCKKDRWVFRGNLLTNKACFTGLCKHCLHIAFPPPKFKRGTRDKYLKIKKDGYIYLTVSGLSDEDKLLCEGMATRKSKNFITTYVIAEHRLVMARALNRPLNKEEVVHHINGDRSDNRIENLQLMIQHHCRGQKQHDLIEEINRLRSILDSHNIKYC